MKNSIIAKLATLGLFILAASFIWAALYLSLSYVIWNIIIGLVGLFFLFRALELVDKVNKFGEYADKPNSAQSEPEDNAQAPDEDDNASGDC